MKFDLTPKEEEVILGDEAYILTEPSEEASRRCNNLLMEGVEGFEFGGEDRQSFKKAKNIADVDSLMVSLCLFKANGESRVPVQLATIRGWPNRVVKELAKRARELGGENEDEIKNS